MADQVGVFDVIAAFAARGHYPSWADAQAWAKKYSTTAALQQFVTSARITSLPTKPSGEIRTYLSGFMGGNAWMLAVPELAKVAITAVHEGWFSDPTRIQGAVQKTSWWKTRTDQQRSWSQVNPAEQQRQVEQTSLKMAAEYQSITGSQMDPHQFIASGAALKLASGVRSMESWTYAVQQIALKNPESPYARSVRQEQETQRQRGVDVENLSGKLGDTARNQYLLNVDDASMMNWARQIAENKSSEEDFTTWARSQAGGMFPAYAKQIEAGVDPATLFGTYRQLAEKELERPITFQDTFLRDALSSPEPLTLSSFQQQVRQRPEWSKTSGANDMASTFAAKLSESFGRAVF